MDTVPSGYGARVYGFKAVGILQNAKHLRCSNVCKNATGCSSVRSSQLRFTPTIPHCSQFLSLMIPMGVLLGSVGSIESLCQKPLLQTPPPTPNLTGGPSWRQEPGDKNLPTTRTSRRQELNRCQPNQRRARNDSANPTESSKQNGRL